MLWQKIKDNNQSNRKLNNVVITGGGSQLDNVEDYVGKIFASGTRIANPLEEYNMQKEYKKPNFSDVIGTVLYDKNIHKIDFIEKKQNLEKKQEFRVFLLG